jgi:5-methylthioadenosine/S-adenosylhomocysteine deaminase
LITDEQELKLLLRGADILTMDGDLPILESTDIAIEHGRIIAIGDIPQDWQADEHMDLTDHLVMPGFWNAHTHAAMTFTRAIGDDLPLERWFNEKIWVAESGLTEEDVYWGTMLAVAEMIRGGTVGIADHYFHMDRVAEVISTAGLKAVLAPTLFGTGVETDFSLAESVAWARKIGGSAEGRIRAMLGPHSPYICPPEFLREVADTAVRENLGIHIHLAEVDEQVQQSRQRHGKSPVAFLADLGVFEVPTLVAHCTAVDDDDLKILARHDVTVVQCPRTHMKMGMGVTPVPEMLARGIRVALGTDGAGSNNNLHMLEEARTAALIQKSHHRDATLMPGSLALRLGTANGAAALGFSDSGVLRVGAAADLIVIDCRKPHLFPRHDLVGNLLYAANSGDIVHSMIDGRWVMLDGYLQTLDEAEILAEASRRAPAMCRRGRTQLRAYQH